MITSRKSPRVLSTYLSLNGSPSSVGVLHGCLMLVSCLFDENKKDTQLSFCRCTSTTQRFQKALMVHRSIGVTALFQKAKKCPFPSQNH